MTTVNLDMLAALREAGVPEALAQKAAAQIPPAEHLVTKADLAQLESRLNERMAQMERRLIGWLFAGLSLAVAVLTFLLK